ncbi:hypothetical protein IE53DRAFT_349337 [Violaceomyces palustris]|uniref:Uncharacterized protein n=1 Tax=Violaceomyces palustris TaxID=1673888 RepID=A0ACD0NNL6_9BASI|nr:hypothetical protein IE53DRAFT_349337 [Violaceomyces palustris]
MPTPKVSLKFLGTSSAPNLTRNFSSLLFKVDNYTLMVDCGESTQRQLISRHIGGDEKLSNLKTILITHLHGDHVLGLVPLLLNLMGPSSSPSAPDDKPRVEIFGPCGLRALIRSTLTLCYSQLTGKYVVHELLWPNQTPYPHRADPTKPPSYHQIPEPVDKRPTTQPYQDPTVRWIPILPPHESELEGKDILMDDSTKTWSRFHTFSPNAKTSAVGEEYHGEGPFYDISAAPILHRCPTLGFTIEESVRCEPLPPSYQKSLLDHGDELKRREGVKHPLALLGRLRMGHSILLPDGSLLRPPVFNIPGRKVTILGDTFDATGGLEAESMGGYEGARAKGMLGISKDSDLLVHECTNAALPRDLCSSKKDEDMLEVLEKARSKGHSTPQVAGRFASKIRARRLVLNHFSIKFPSATHPSLQDEGGHGVGSGKVKGVHDEEECGEASEERSRRFEAKVSENERRFRVMREIEDQATEAWHSGLVELGGLDVQSEESKEIRSRRAIASFDGFSIEVPPHTTRIGHEESEEARRTLKRLGVSPQADPKVIERKKVEVDDEAAKVQGLAAVEDEQTLEWNPSPFLLESSSPSSPPDPTRRSIRAREYAIIMLNCEVNRKQLSTLRRLWQNARFRICADGGANRILDTFGKQAFAGGDGDVTSRMKLPDAIVGDLDSVREEVVAWFHKMGVEIRRVPSQYATDLQKSVQTLQDLESNLFPIVEGQRQEMELIIYGGLSGRLDQTAHTLHVLWQLCKGAQELGGIVEPVEEGGDGDGGGATPPNQVSKRSKTWAVGDGSLCWLLSKVSLWARGAPPLFRP